MGVKRSTLIDGRGVPLAVAVDAARQLIDDGTPTRVVSLPSWDRFRAQGPEYRDELFPDGVPVLSVEAAVTFGWSEFADASIGIDRFGVSAPGEQDLTAHVNFSALIDT